MARLICALICVFVWVGSRVDDVNGVYWGILRSLSRSGDKCVHSQGDSSGAPLELIPCSLGSPGQHFDVGRWGDYYVAQPLVFRSGLCVTGDPRPPPPSNGGAKTSASDCLGQPHQSWTIEGSQLGAASPFQLLGSNGKCLTAEADGVYFDQWDCGSLDSSPHQWFIMERVPVIIALSNAAIKNKCIHIVGDSATNGAQLDLAPCAASVSQFFNAHELSAYVSTPGPLRFLSGRCLTGPVSDLANGVIMTSSDCVADAPAQKWKVVGGVPFSSSFQLMGSNGKCLSQQNDGQHIVQWDCVLTEPAQRFMATYPVRVGLLASSAWSGLCVHIKDDSLINLATLAMTPCDPSSVAQQFDITDWGTYAAVGGRLEFVSGRCITGDPPLMWNCEDAPHQLWRMRSGSLYETNNNFQLVASNGLCLNPNPENRGGSFTEARECGDWASAPHQFFHVDISGVAAPVAPSAPPPPPPVPQCLKDQETCNPADVQCCAGEYCHPFYSTWFCRACLPEGEHCGTSPVAQQCCDCCSCRADPVPGSIFNTCQRGACGELGGDCSAGQPCCGQLVCSTWSGGSFVCRPPQPSCGKTGDTSSACISCCAKRCIGGGLDSSIAEDIAFISGGCECATSDHRCVDNSYCCSGKCGIDYVCID